MKIKDLKPADYNPAQSQTNSLSALKNPFRNLGFVGIVFNRRTDNLVGGHQRLKCLPPDAKIEKKNSQSPPRTGTVAEGYIIIPSSVVSAEAGIQKEERYSHREVDWPVEKKKPPTSQPTNRAENLTMNVWRHSLRNSPNFLTLMLHHRLARRR